MFLAVGEVLSNKTHRREIPTCAGTLILLRVLYIARTRLDGEAVVAQFGNGVEGESLADVLISQKD